MEFLSSSGLAAAKATDSHRLHAEPSIGYWDVTLDTADKLHVGNYIQEGLQLMGALYQLFTEMRRCLDCATAHLTSRLPSFL